MKAQTHKTYTVEFTHDEALQLVNCINAIHHYLAQGVVFSDLDQNDRLHQLRVALGDEVARR